jgi:hypothetical protein
MDAREANDRIAEKAARLRFVSRVPMLCECSTPSCRTVVMVSLTDYHALRDDETAFLTAPGHTAASGSHLQSETAAYDVHQDDSRPGDDRLRSA